MGSQASKGKLNATVSANGTATLTHNGKTVSILKAGLYKVCDFGAGCERQLHHPWPDIDGADDPRAARVARGTHTRMIRLTRGRWTCCTTLEKIRYFRVT